MEFLASIPRELVYALPLTGYMLTILVLSALVVPRCWRGGAGTGYRTWKIQDKAVAGRLIGVSDADVWVQTNESVMRPPRSALSPEDHAYVDKHASSVRYSRHSRLFLILAGLSLAVTWTYMIQYFALSLATYISTHVVQKRIAQSPLSALRLGHDALRRQQELLLTPLHWLRDVSLFDEAWSHVCATPARWLLSTQLCLFAVTVFSPLIMTSRFERRTYGLSTLVLGQIVAISVATGLLLRLPSRPAADVSLFLWPGLIGAAALTGFLPHVTGTSNFLPVLLGLHGLLFAPLLPVARTPRHKLRLDFLFFALAFAATLVHLDALAALQFPKAGSAIVQILTGEVRPDWTLDTARQVVFAVAEAFLAHPAQASIGSDALLCGAIFLLFVATDRYCPGRPSWTIAVAIAVLVPFIGLGAAGAIYLAFRERLIVDEMRRLEEL